jgi:hypothetical protein
MRATFAEPGSLVAPGSEAVTIGGAGRWRLGPDLPDTKPFNRRHRGRAEMKGEEGFVAPATSADLGH